MHNFVFARSESLLNWCRSVYSSSMNATLAKTIMLVVVFWSVAQLSISGDYEALADCTVSHRDQMPTENSYGPAFHQIGGGYFAMERTTVSIKFWFWPRGSSEVPHDVRDGLPVVDTQHWGLPDAHFNNDACDIEAKFQPAFVLINLTLCGEISCV